MFDADSQNFASAPSVPRGFKRKNFGPPSAGTAGGPWEEGVPANPPPPRPLQIPPPHPLPPFYYIPGDGVPLVASEPSISCTEWPLVCQLPGDPGLHQQICMALPTTPFPLWFNPHPPPPRPSSDDTMRIAKTGKKSLSFPRHLQPPGPGYQPMTVSRSPSAASGG